MYGAEAFPWILDQLWFSMRMTNTVVLLVVASVVVVVVIRPQSGGVGLVAALHAFPLAFFSCLHAFLQALPARRLRQADLRALNSGAISCLQSLPHLARAGEPTRPAAMRAVVSKQARARRFRVMGRIGPLSSTHPPGGVGYTWRGLLPHLEIERQEDMPRPPWVAHSSYWIGSPASGSPSAPPRSRRW